MSNQQKIESEKGVPVLKLPKRGEDLVEGRQYYLDPVARATAKEEYGLALPREIECIRRKHPATRITSHNENLETGVTKITVMECPAQSATFRAFLKKDKIEVFTLDLKRISELRQFYADSHKAAELELEELNEAKKSHAPRAKKPVAPIDIDALFASLGV